MSRGFERGTPFSGTRLNDLTVPFRGARMMREPPEVSAWANESSGPRQATDFPVALTRRSAQFFEMMREVAATFVDIVKFAMRGLLAPTVASFG